MGGLISSGVSNSADFYLRDFYSNNRDVRKTNKRSDFSHVELVYEDSLALKNASKKLNKYTYSEDENKENTENTVKAFVDTYNNALTSTNKLNSDTMKKYANQLQRLSSKYKDELKDIGISIEANGTMKINDTLLKAASSDKIEKVFGKDIGYTKSIRSLTNRMNNAAFNEIYAEATGNGTNINISL